MVVANHVDRALGHATSSLAISRIKDKLTKTSQSNVAVSVLTSALVFSKDNHVCFCSVESCMRDKRQ